MNISLSTQTFDPAGLLMLRYDPESSTSDLVRRVSRTATMDGGCTFDDLGFSWSDIDLSLRFSAISSEQESALAYLVKSYGLLTAVTNQGAFTVLVESYSFREGAAEIKLLIVGQK